MKTKLFFLPLLILINNCFAASFAIVPFKPLPTTVPKGGTVAAYYIVTNTTASTLSNNQVKSFPLNVTQIKCDPNFCSDLFQLGPQGSPTESCILKLTVAGNVDPIGLPLSVCTSTNDCVVPQPSLAVSEILSSPLIAMGAGRFNTQSNNLPLVALSNDNGQNWDFPASIYSNLTLKIDPSLESGLFTASSCTGVGPKALCVASGDWCTSGHCFPLVGVSGKGVNTDWSFPKEIYQNLTSAIDPNLVNAFLFNNGCTGSANKSICIAAGQYQTPNNVIPLAAVTDNAGMTWTYPKAIFQNLTTQIDPNFKNGLFSGSSCTGTSCNAVCMAAGRYCTDEGCDKEFPLVAFSKNGGKDWVYPHAIFENIKNLIPNFLSGFFNAASCTGSGTSSICVAAGQYYNSHINNTEPLLAISQDGGTTWTYPDTIFKNLFHIMPGYIGGYLKSASCNGAVSKAVCIATGVYFTETEQFPILALSSDGGKTWRYPTEIFEHLHASIDPQFKRGSFESASCSPTGICTAAGSYCREDCNNHQFPLIAFTSDRGAHWHYPTAIYQNLTTTLDPKFDRGLFLGASCTSSDSQNLCIATGEYTQTGGIGNTIPMLAFTTDEGSTWQYPASIHENLETKLPDFTSGSLTSAAATGGAKFKYKRPPF